MRPVHAPGYAAADVKPAPAESHTSEHLDSVLSGRLGQGLILTGIILAVELVGGFLSGSLALMADAGHVTTDVIALGLAWYAVEQTKRPADEARTFGLSSRRHPGGDSQESQGRSQSTISHAWTSICQAQRRITNWTVHLPAAIDHHADGVVHDLQTHGRSHGRRFHRCLLFDTL